MSEIAKILVWNMNGFSSMCDDVVKTRRVKLLEGMFDEHKPSLFALQETFDDLVTRLSSTIRSQYNITVGARGLASGYLKADWNKNGRPYDHETVRTTMLPLQHTRIADTHVHFWNLHLRVSDASTEEQEGHIKLFCGALEQQRAKSRGKRQNNTEILAGDFNMDPFHDFIIGRARINANRSIEFADSSHAPRPYEDRRLLNTAWCLLGRTRPPLGTYYKTGFRGGPWYVYDQVLLSPAHCIPHRSQARLILKVDKKTLYGPRTKIKSPDESIGSDHFPLRVRFQIG